MNTDGVLRVLYYDDLGFEHNGTVVLTTPITTAGADDLAEDYADGIVVYCFIQDDREDFNDKVYHPEDGSPDIKYAEIRRSDQCIRLS